MWWDICCFSVWLRGEKEEGHHACVVGRRERTEVHTCDWSSACSDSGKTLHVCLQNIEIWTSGKLRRLIQAPIELQK